jgi:hypothetical protein
VVYGSDFNYDFHVTLDESVAPPEYNYRPLEVDWEEPKGRAKAVRTAQPDFAS